MMVETAARNPISLRTGGAARRLQTARKMGYQAMVYRTTAAPTASPDPAHIKDFPPAPGEPRVRWIVAAVRSLTVFPDRATPCSASRNTGHTPGGEPHPVGQRGKPRADLALIF